MSLESNIADLNTATAGLLTAINTQKAVLGQLVASSDLAASSGADGIGRKSNISGSYQQTVSEKLKENYSVLERMTPAERADALAGTQLLDHTASIQAAINWGVVNGGNLIFPYAKYNVTSLQVIDAVQTFSIEMKNPIIFGSATTAKNGIIEIVNCVQFSILGSCCLHAQDKPVYSAGLYIRAQAGTSAATTRVNIYNITVRNAKAAFNIGEYNIDRQCSEITLFGCNSFACPVSVNGGGSQSGASFIGCNLVSENNPILGGALKSAMFEGGFWYISGGSVVQTSAVAGNVAIEVRPCLSTTYSSPYAIVKIANAHVESSGVLLYVNNIRAISSPYSLSSSISFSNTSGYISSNAPGTLIDSTGDNTYSGTIVFDSGNKFYGDLGVNRSVAHIYLGTNTNLDLDGTPFGQSFFQGLSAIATGYLGKPRLRGETILALFNASNAIASSGGTIVNFSQTVVTNDSVYGTTNYSAGSFTSPQTMKDIQISFQIYFASAAPNADVWVAINGVATGFYASFSNAQCRSGCIVIPKLNLGDVVTLRANTNTGGAINLLGGIENFFRINAKT